MKHKITLILLCLAGFFITWGEGMQLIMPNSSLIYPTAIGFLLIIYWEEFVKYPTIFKRASFREYRWFIGFLVLHTFIFIILNPAYVSFGKEVIIEDGDYVFQKAAAGEQLVKSLEFILFSFLLVKLLGVKLYRNVFFISYVIGFLFTILLSGYAGEYNNLTRLSGGMKDPNIMAVDALVILAFTLYYYKLKSSYIIRFACIVVMIFALYAILFSFSRGAMLALLVGLFIYFTRKVKTSKVISAVVIFIVAIYFLYYLIPSDVRELISLRFSLNEAMETGGAGRTDIWKLYLSYWYDYFVTGTGFTNCQSVLFSHHLDEYRVTHNEYIKMFVELGFFGLVLYLRFLVKGYRVFLKINNSDVFLVLPFIFIIIVTLFLNIDTGRNFWVIISLLNFAFVANFGVKTNKVYNNQKKEIL